MPPAAPQRAWVDEIASLRRSAGGVGMDVKVWVCGIRVAHCHATEVNKRKMTAKCLPVEPEVRPAAGTREPGGWRCIR
jgi:hypothetical protein